MTSNYFLENFLNSLKSFIILQMTAWVSSKFVPGQFTGSTGANVMSSKELNSGFQAWAKRVSEFMSFYIKFKIFLRTTMKFN